MSNQPTLTDHLKANDLLTPELEECLKQYYKMNQKSKDKFTWGKYKSKDIKKVFEMDEDYCLWMAKQQYCSKAHKDLIQSLIE